MVIIAVKGISKRYKKTVAVKSCDLQVASGNILSLLGPSGSGKTTLLRLIAGFERPDQGLIVINGRTVVDVDRSVWVPAEDRGVGMVFQEYALFPHLTVAQNVRFGLRNGNKGDRQSRVDELLRLTELFPYGARYPHELSGGQQQRVAVARALAPRPPVVLLDEPFNALDAALRAELRRDVWQALRADGATAVLVTHDQAEALSMADEVAVMRDGRIIQSGPPELLYGSPADPWVAGFVGEA